MFPPPPERKVKREQLAHRQRFSRNYPTQDPPEWSSTKVDIIILGRTKVMDYSLVSVIILKVKIVSYPPP